MNGRNLDPIVERIQKLLSLANSDNENEAKAAANKASELLIKYNLNLQQVKDTEFSYGNFEIGNLGLKVKDYQKMIAGVLHEFFFVRVVVQSKHVGYSENGARTQYRRIMGIIGTEENAQIASYIFAYLNEAYPKLWKEFKKTHQRGPWYIRNSYYRGLTAGIRDMLEKTKWRVQQEAGLVLVDDPGLDKYLKEHTGGGTYHGRENNDVDSRAFLQGAKDGMNVKLRKPITTGPVKAAGLMIKGAK